MNIIKQAMSRMTFNKAPSINQKRRAGESYRDYRTRRLFEQEAMRQYLRGRVFWPSSTRGTYERGAR